MSWIFNYNIYKEMKRNLKYEDNANGFITVFIELPFAIPFREKDTYTFYYQNRLVGICTEHVIHDYTYRNNTTDLLKNYKSNVEIVFFMNKHISKSESELLAHEYVDIAIEVINYIIDIFIAYKHSLVVYRVSRMDIPIIIPTRCIRSKNFKDKMIDVFAMTNFYCKDELLEPKYLIGEDRLAFLDQINGHKLNPFIQSVLFLRQAYKELNTGKFNNTIISVQTSIEIFFSVVLRQILLNKENKKESEIGNIFNAGYKNWMNDHLSKYIEAVGYKFEFRNKMDMDKENVLFEYIDKIYQKRNNIVHRGEVYSEEDAIEAYYKTEEIYYKMTDIINSTELREIIYGEEFSSYPLLR